jgi:hypothetical protein
MRPSSRQRNHSGPLGPHTGCSVNHSIYLSSLSIRRSGMALLHKWGEATPACPACTESLPRHHEHANVVQEIMVFFMNGRFQLFFSCYFFLVSPTSPAKNSSVESGVWALELLRVHVPPSTRTCAWRVLPRSGSILRGASQLGRAGCNWRCSSRSAHAPQRGEGSAGSGYKTPGSPSLKSGPDSCSSFGDSPRGTERTKQTYG